MFDVSPPRRAEKSGVEIRKLLYHYTNTPRVTQIPREIQRNIITNNMSSVQSYKHQTTSTLLIRTTLKAAFPYNENLILWLYSQIENPHSLYILFYFHELLNCYIRFLSISVTVVFGGAECLAVAN